MEERKTPTGERILSLLIDLYAEQENLKIEYEIKKGVQDEKIQVG